MSSPSVHAGARAPRRACALVRARWNTAVYTQTRRKNENRTRGTKPQRRRDRRRRRWGCTLRGEMHLSALTMWDRHFYALLRPASLTRALSEINYTRLGYRRSKGASKSVTPDDLYRTDSAEARSRNGERERERGGGRERNSCRINEKKERRK